jgi:hypothetical protein
LSLISAGVLSSFFCDFGIPFARLRETFTREIISRKAQRKTLGAKKYVVSISALQF